MTTLRLLTLKNSERNLHRIFVSFVGIEEDWCENVPGIIYKVLEYFRRLNKGKYDRQNYVSTRVLRYMFEKGRSSSKGKKTFVVEVKNATTEDCKILASMIYSCICLDFYYDEETIRLDALNMDFPDVMAQYDEVEAMKI